MRVAKGMQPRFLTPAMTVAGLFLLANRAGCEISATEQMWTFFAGLSRTEITHSES